MSEGLFSGSLAFLNATYNASDDGDRSIHCGTNVIREVPTYDWWDF